MKRPLPLLLIFLVGTSAYFAGGWSGARTSGTNSSGAGENSRTSPRTYTQDADATPVKHKTAPDRVDSRKDNTGRGEIDTAQASRLTPAARIELMKQAATLADIQRQSAMLRGLISAMTKEELEETTATLLTVQSRGNSWSPDVWNALWTRWGMVDPVGCLARSELGNGLNTVEDYRWMVSGWLETDPAAATAWAKTADPNSPSAPAIAYVITNGAGGDLQKLEAAILAIPEGRQTVEICLGDYFDLALGSEEGRSASSVYDNLNPSLRDDAWPIVMRRLAYNDPYEAASWLEQHAGDPGRDYRSAQLLVNALSVEDPAGTANWALRFPEGGPTEISYHPAAVAIRNWLGRDEAAARAWLRSLPSGSPWPSRFPVANQAFNPSN